MPDELDAMLDNYDESQVELGKRRAEAEKKAEVVRKESSKLVDEHIAPVLNDFANRMKARGHTSFADTEETRGSISLVPKGASSSTERPRLVFTVGGDEVRVHGSNILSGRGGSSGSRDPIKLEELSQDKVREVTLAWAKEVLEGPWVSRK